MRWEGWSKQQFGEALNEFIRECFRLQGTERANYYTNLMEVARSYGLEKQAADIAAAICEREGEPELWELPKPFDRAVSLPKLTEHCLPPKLREYLQAVSKYVQVAPEMGVLPMLSVLSLCVQGKAVISHPKSDHTEPLNIYTMTIAAPGERKSGCFKEFISPVNEYLIQHNEALRSAIRAYATKRAFLENQRERCMKGAKADLKKAQEYDKELADLKEVRELKLYVKDTTPEALAGELALHGGRMAVLDDEGSVFDVLAGLYSSGQVNINIFLEAYDGTPYTISRKTSGDLTLQDPLLTVGLMVQPAHYAQAMCNSQFSGRGFIHRFMFAFPEMRAGHLRFASPNIPPKIKAEYDSLVSGLLALPQLEKPLTICHSREAELLFEDYHDHLQREMKKSGQFENMKEWASKQFARALRVAGIFHMVEHAADIKQAAKTPLSGENAAFATALSLWEEQQAMAAFSGECTDSEAVRNAKLILEKLMKLKVNEMTKSEMLLRKITRLSAKELCEPLQLLADLNYIRVIEERSSPKSKPKMIIQVNPNIKIDKIDKS